MKNEIDQIKLIVTGPNNYKDEVAVRSLLERLAAKYDSPFIMTKARKGGLDEIIEKAAWKLWLTVQRFHPDGTNPKQAVAAQIVEMANKATKGFFFYDGRDSETADAIRIASNIGLKGKVIRY